MKNRKDNMKTKKIKDTKMQYKDVDRDNNGTVYMFHNIRHNTMLFVNAENGNEAAAIFDSCGFARRTTGKYF